MYTVVIGDRNKKSRVTWADDYRFDFEKETITLLSEENKPIMQYQFDGDKVYNIDIYQSYQNTGSPIQSFIWSGVNF